MSGSGALFDDDERHIISDLASAHMSKRYTMLNHTMEMKQVWILYFTNIIYAKYTLMKVKHNILVCSGIIEFTTYIFLFDNSL